MRNYLISSKYDRGIRHGVTNPLPKGKVYHFLCDEDEMNEERYDRFGEGVEVCEFPQGITNINEALRHRRLAHERHGKDIRPSHGFIIHVTKKKKNV